MPKTRHERRTTSHSSGVPMPSLVPTPTDILRRAFPAGNGKTPWAARPGRRWVCQECGARLSGYDLASATVKRRPWGNRIVWQHSEWRHSVRADVLDDSALSSVEGALRQVLESRFAAVRWNSTSQKLEKALGRRTGRSGWKRDRQ